MSLSLPVTDAGAAADRAQWLADRRNGIGSSDAAAILGLSRANPVTFARAVVAEVQRQERVGFPCWSCGQPLTPGSEGCNSCGAEATPF